MILFTFILLTLLCEKQNDFFNIIIIFILHIPAVFITVFIAGQALLNYLQFPRLGQLLSNSSLLFNIVQQVGSLFLLLLSSHGGHSICICLSVIINQHFHFIFVILDVILVVLVIFLITAIWQRVSEPNTEKDFSIHL